MYASSSSVYGNSNEFPLSENQTNLKPISFYGSTKLSNEFLAEKISLNTGTTTLGLRFFSVYGPWGRPDMAYFKILQSLMTDQEFQMFGTGELVRDMTHVFDVIKSISLLQECIQIGSVPIPKVINIGGGRPHSLIKLISVLEGLSGKKLYIEHLPSSKLDVNRTEADFSRLQNLIAYRPLIDIEEGAKNLLEWAENPEIRSILHKGMLL